MKKRKTFKRLKKSAIEYLDQISDEDLSSLAGMQKTMNQFLASQGLPPVGIPGVSDPVIPGVENRSFDEVSDDLLNHGINT